MQERKERKAKSTEKIKRTKGKNIERTRRKKI